MEMYPNTSQVFDIDMFMYSFQDIKFALSNYRLLYILIGKVLINESLILHYHKDKKKSKNEKKLFQCHKQDYIYNDNILFAHIKI